MVLKEAYEYKNYLKNLFQQVLTFLSNQSFTMKEVKHHRCLQVTKNPDFKEVIDTLGVSFTPNQLIDFSIKVINEIDTLNDAIAKAKASIEFNIDGQMDLNKSKSELLRYFETMKQYKSSEKEMRESAYVFNNDGNQITAYYPVTVVKTIDFDRNRVKSYAEKLDGDIRDTSNKKNLLELTTTVNYNPTWLINTSLEDCLLN